MKSLVGSRSGQFKYLPNSHPISDLLRAHELVAAGKSSNRHHAKWQRSLRLDLEFPFPWVHSEVRLQKANFDVRIMNRRLDDECFMKNLRARAFVYNSNRVSSLLVLQRQYPRGWVVSTYGTNNIVLTWHRVGFSVSEAQHKRGEKVSLPAWIQQIKSLSICNSARWSFGRSGEREIG